MGILFGLSSALCWGSSDFLATPVARRIGVLAITFYTQIVGLVLFGGLLLLLPSQPTGTLAAWGLCLLASIVNLFGGLLLFRAYTIGTLALVAPIASGYAVVSALLAVATGERLTALALAGVVLVVGGVMLAARTAQGSPARLAGVPSALGVTVCFGVYFWSLKFITPDLGVFWPVLMVKLVDVVGVLLLVTARGRQMHLPQRTDWLPLVAASVLNTLAFVSYNAGVTLADTAIVAPLSSLASAVTVLLAWGLLHERLARWQWAGVGGIVVGVILVSM